MKEVIRLVTEGLTLHKIAEKAECTVGTISKRIRSNIRYTQQFVEARALASEAHVQAALDAIDITDDQVASYGKQAGPVVAMRKTRADVLLRMAKADDPTRFAEYQKPVSAPPTVIIAINGRDTVSGRDMTLDIAAGRGNIIEAVAPETKTFQEMVTQNVGRG